MSRPDDRLHPIDEAILCHLAATGVDYPTCIAVRREADPADVERRCEALADSGLVEPVSHEVVYRVTTAGLRRLDARRASEHDGSKPTDGRDDGPTGENSESPQSPPTEVRTADTR